MAQRRTRRAGITKTRVSDAQVQRQLDAIIERLEVLDGIRGDDLDKAVTFRDLTDANFTVSVGGSTGTTITSVPPSTGGVPVPTVGPAGPPTGLAATETFLAILLTWTNTAFNLQHVEVWRSATNNLSSATKIGTTVSPQFVDYVGASQTYYYWVRSVGTDGTFSAYHPTGPTGIEGTTGIDPGNLTIDPRFFVLEDGTGTELPFLTDGAGNIGIDGDLIVDGTIRAQSIVAGTIGADQLVGNSLSALYADLGTVTAGLFRTADSPAFRVEVEDQASTAFPLWYGSGAKADAGGLFYVDNVGNVVVRGLLDAGIIRQTLFTPSSSTNPPFRIATQYPSFYSGGAYTGKTAHLFPIQSRSTTFDGVGGVGNLAGRGWTLARLAGSSLIINTPYTGETITFTGPVASGNTQWLRLGSYNETFIIMFSASCNRYVEIGATGGSVGPGIINVTVQYRYDSGSWLDMTTVQMRGGDTGSISFNQAFATRASPAFSSVSLRLFVEFDRILSANADTTTTFFLDSVSLTAFSSNFGYGDASVSPITPTGQAPEALPDFPYIV